MFEDLFKNSNERDNCIAFYSILFKNTKSARIALDTLRRANES